MRKVKTHIITLLAITTMMLLLSFSACGQTANTGVYRVANATTQFGQNMPAGTIIFDNNTGNEYYLLHNIKSSESISTLTYLTDYYQYLKIDGTAANSTKWNGNLFSSYLNQPVLTGSSPTFYNLTIRNIYPAANNIYDIGSSTNYFFHIFTNNLYTYGTGYFSGNVNEIGRAHV